MMLNIMDLMISDEITENPDGIRPKPDITVIENHIFMTNQTE